MRMEDHVQMKDLGKVAKLARGHVTAFSQNILNTAEISLEQTMYNFHPFARIHKSILYGKYDNELICFVSISYRRVFCIIIAHKRLLMIVL